MAQLTYEERAHLPSNAFVFPKTRAYPIETEARARNALARVSQFGSPTEKKKVRIAVKRKFPKIGNQVQIIKQHDDGDLTIKQGKDTFVVTTDRRLFREVKPPHGRQLRSLPARLIKSRRIIHTRIGTHTALSRHYLRHRR